MAGEGQRPDASMRVVVLCGPEEYLRLTYTRMLVEALQAEHGEIERFEFDGTVAEPAAVLDELRSYALLSGHKLVILDHAAAFFAPRSEDPPAREGRGRGRPAPRTARALFEKYAADPLESATLLLRSETWRPDKLDRLVTRVGAVIRCETPGAAAAVRFCGRRCGKAYGCEIAPEAAQLLVQRVGPVLARLDAELGKLAAHVGPAGTIGPAEVRAFVPLSREERAWAIQSVLLSGSARGSVETLRELLRISRQPEALITWSIMDLLRKLHTAAHLIRRGTPAGAIRKELRLYGRGGNELLDVAGRLDPRQAAQLLLVAVEADRGIKSGLGQAPRTLEALAVRIADTLKCA